MRTAVDSSVLWSIFKGESDARAWVDVLIAVRQESGLIICDIVCAEISPLFKDFSEMNSRLEALGIEYVPIDFLTAFEAGRIFKRYRQEGGPRRNLIPDFLIGAHALHQAGCLAARDRGYLRRYFPRLSIITPDASSTRETPPS
jgi:predicted nucleic acid-binding protein